MKGALYVAVLAVGGMMIFGGLQALAAEKTPAPAPPAASTYTAVLTGAEEVPPVTTTASGTVVFTPNSDNTQMTYRLEVKGLKDFKGAHIHLGDRGTNGKPVVMLDSKAKEGEFSGVLAEGVIKASELKGGLKGKKIEDLAKDMKEGKLYVNVHTKAHPDGEIRGQIMESAPAAK